MSPVLSMRLALPLNLSRKDWPCLVSFYSINIIIGDSINATVHSKRGMSKYHISDRYIWVVSLYLIICFQSVLVFDSLKLAGRAHQPRNHRYIPLSYLLYLFKGQVDSLSLSYKNKLKKIIYKHNIQTYPKCIQPLLSSITCKIVKS